MNAQTSAILEIKHIFLFATEYFNIDFISFVFPQPPLGQLHHFFSNNL